RRPTRHGQSDPPLAKTFRRRTKPHARKSDPNIQRPLRNPPGRAPDGRSDLRHHRTSNAPRRLMPQPTPDAFTGPSFSLGPGITIGEGAVVGARSVVTKDLPPWMVCAGNPCLPIKPRAFKKQE